MSKNDKNVFKKKLESSDKLFRAMVENGFDAIAIVNKEVKPLYISPRAHLIIGYTEDEVFELGTLQTVHPDDLSYIQSKLEECFQNPGIPIGNLNYRIKHKNGHWMWAEATITNFLKDPVIKGILVNFRDVSDRKRMEIQLTNIADNVNGLVFRYHLDHNGKDKLLYLNKNSIKVWGVDAKDAMEDTAVIWSKIHPEDVPEMVQSIIRSAESMEDWSWEWRYNHPDGSLRWQKGAGTPQKMADGSTIWDSIILDITAIKSAEEKLKQLNSNLIVQTEELETSNQELEQFAYVASHDLQEPLRMVTGFLKLLENKYSRVLDDKARKYIQMSLDGADRMRKLIIGLLEFSRVGKSNDRTEKIDINELLEEIKILLKKEIADKNAEFEISRMPQITSFRIPLQQIFHNLVGNALKYSFSDIPVKIKIDSRDSGTHWEFSIQDNGIGIPKDSFDKIFEIFQRLHSNEEYQGTGMGLAITKKIVESMGGEIWVLSEVGKGSAFFFNLPKNQN